MADPAVPAPRVSGEVRIVALPGFPEVGGGDDVPALIARSLAAAGESLMPGDVVVVTSKVVSKAAGLVAPNSIERRDVVAAETVRVVTERMGAGGPTRIVEGRSGVVMAGAGVDASNTGPSGAILTLPPDPDAAAADLHAGLAHLAGHDAFGVVVSDTAGRPWRAGQVDFALGAHGVRVLVDYRGRPDADGRRLDLTAVAVADEIAAAADLVKGKVTATPVALVRGLAGLVEGGPAGAGAVDAQSPGRGARRLVRTGPNDFFRLGHVEAVRAALGVAPGSPGSVAVGLRATGPEALAVRLARAIRLAAADLPAHPLSWRWQEPRSAPAGAPTEWGRPRDIPVGPADTGHPDTPASTTQTGDHEPTSPAPGIPVSPGDTGRPLTPAPTTRTGDHDPTGPASGIPVAPAGIGRPLTPAPATQTGDHDPTSSASGILVSPGDTGRPLNPAPATQTGDHDPTSPASGIPSTPSYTAPPDTSTPRAQTGDQDPARAGAVVIIEVGGGECDDFILGRLAARLEVALHAEDLVGSVVRGPHNKLTIRVRAARPDPT